MPEVLLHQLSSSWLFFQKQIFCDPHELILVIYEKQLQPVTRKTGQAMPLEKSYLRVETELK